MGISSELTDKQKLFIQEYLIDLNATQAAIRAGYSIDTAGSIGHEILKKPEIQIAIQEAFDKRSKRTEITQDMVLAELARCGFSNMANYAKWNPDGVTLVSSEDLTEDAARCVAEVSQTVTAEGGTVKFKLHDKISALEKVGRHLGMFKDKFELTGKDGKDLIPAKQTNEEIDIETNILLEKAAARVAKSNADSK